MTFWSLTNIWYMKWQRWLLLARNDPEHADEYGDSCAIAHAEYELALALETVHDKQTK